MRSKLKEEAAQRKAEKEAEVAQNIDKMATGAQEAIDKKVNNFTEFINKMRQTNMLRGETGQLSEVQQGDIDLANMMKAPNTKVNNRGVLANTLSNYDQDMAAMQSQLYQDDTRKLRGMALQLMQDYDLAQRIAADETETTGYPPTQKRNGW